MKIILSVIVVLAIAVQAKAQTKPTLPFTFKQLAPIKTDSNNFFGEMSKPDKSLTVNFSNFYDPMPVAKLQGNSKMPVLRIEGYDRMPNAYAEKRIDSISIQPTQITPILKSPNIINPLFKQTDH